MADTTSPVTLVIGSRGLLGSGVVRYLRREARNHHTVAVRWGDRSAAVADLTAAAEELMAQGRPWRLLWCAGSGVVASDPARLDEELDTLTAFLAAFEAVLARPGTPVGAFFLASSAGGVYAGSEGPPFTELTEPRPISPYGVAKLTAELQLRAFAERTGVAVLVGRIANLYGPGQDPSKAQGLITVLCRAHLARRPASIYVSLDTARDYVFVDDVAALAVIGTDRIASQPPGSVVTKILASRNGTTVAAILGELRRLTKRRPLVVLGTSPFARFQARDLRFRSDVWADLDHLFNTSLPAGVAATMHSALRELQDPGDAQSESRAS